MQCSSAYVYQRVHVLRGDSQRRGRVLATLVESANDTSRSAQLIRWLNVSLRCQTILYYAPLYAISVNKILQSSHTVLDLQDHGGPQQAVEIQEVIQEGNSLDVTVAARDLRRG